MLILGIVVALVLGVLARGDLGHLGRVSFQGVALLFAGVLLRYATEFAIRSAVEPAETLRLPLYGLAFGLVAAALWLNREKPGLIVAAAGVTANGAAIVANGGWMPVWGPALQIAGMPEAD